MLQSASFHCAPQSKLASPTRSLFEFIGSIIGLTGTSYDLRYNDEGATAPAGDFPPNGCPTLQLLTTP